MVRALLSAVSATKSAASECIAYRSATYRFQTEQKIDLVERKGQSKGKSSDLLYLYGRVEQVY